ncbi:hypothetical protein K443DRAFT_656062 [Laccaria amethystina LaAM-08-1]|uniref:Uncharacterized protein n=1 Tax=Laccaria amethystina LaAM-08-1 TaxID=1095629 RepID=A0A0C9XZ73_9AGAR|nr:hypothetical protein K443DRAFT_656062 [Laccaria amethystina LaAM-08-1]
MTSSNFFPNMGRPQGRSPPPILDHIFAIRPSHSCGLGRSSCCTWRSTLGICLACCHLRWTSYLPYS